MKIKYIWFLQLICFVVKEILANPTLLRRVDLTNVAINPSDIKLLKFNEGKSIVFTNDTIGG